MQIDSTIDLLLMASMCVFVPDQPVNKEDGGTWKIQGILGYILV